MNFHTTLNDFVVVISVNSRIKYFFIVLVYWMALGWSNEACAQIPSQQLGANLVPNNGFEEIKKIPIKWYFKGDDFNEIMKYWTSPTSASPDIYTYSTKVPENWAEKGFGNDRALKGDAMVGITTYGCIVGKPHCREYVQVKLKETLIIGQEYQVSMIVKPLSVGLRANNMGIFASIIEVKKSFDQRLKCKPQWKYDKIIAPGEKAWQTIQGKFTSQTSANYLVIGNFFIDSLTRTSGSDKAKDYFAYYYLDEVTLNKIPPYVIEPSEEGTFEDCCLKIGDTISLKNIYFDFDKSLLRPKSFVELNKILRLMLNNTNFKIQITGHTDKVGNHKYNTELSTSRAKSVLNFLIDNGVDEDRLSLIARSYDQPASTNKTEEGRQLNRRVELIIVDY